MKSGKTKSETIISKEVISIERAVSKAGGIPEQKLRDKCNWEHMSRTAVIKIWGDPRAWQTH